MYEWNKSNFVVDVLFVISSSNSSMVVADVLVPNRHQIICNHHTDFENIATYIIFRNIRAAL